jgi:pimeloyl-ACP methyl ester carboxylesterase
MLRSPRARGRHGGKDHRGGAGLPAQAIHRGHPAQHRRLSVLSHDTSGRLAHITAPTLVLAGGLDKITPPRYGRIVADSIPHARFEVLPEEAHQPFQEAPDLFNNQVDTFWQQVDARD